MANQLCSALVLVEADIVENDDIAGRQFGNELSFDVAFKMAAFIGVLTIHGATRPWHRNPAMKVCVCHLPNGACVLKRSPFGAQPVRLVSLVLVDG